MYLLSTLPLGTWNSCKTNLVVSFLPSQSSVWGSGKETSTTGDVYNNYQRLCKKTGLDPLTQRRISGLLSELDTQGLVNASIINQGRHGRTKKISSHISQDIINKVLSDDSTAKILLI